MGQGGYVLEYPEMHKLGRRANAALNGMHDYMMRLDPARTRDDAQAVPRESAPEFCSSCHKVHLDVPVNNYRWFRGFNEYDAWQASGVSGRGRAPSTIPTKPKDCADCHMPLVKSADAANRNGFGPLAPLPGANTAVPFANGDTEQLEDVRTSSRRTSSAWTSSR
jgi:hypothetical protein